MYIKADTLDDLMRSVFSRILRRGQSITPRRGVASELVGVLLHLTNPRARLSRSESRGRVFSALGELLWYLAKTKTLAFISYYIPEYTNETDDGRTVYGAYGPRLFNKNGIDQTHSVLELLRNQPHSRRAVIQLFDASDLVGRHKNIPCTCTLQFILRAGHLTMVTSMRSNDAYLGLPHDVFAFTMIQELFARSLGVDVGQYYQAVGSLHLYNRDRASARRYFNEGWQATTAPMPPMPPGRPWRSISGLLAAEAELRVGRKAKRWPRSHPYWQDLLRLLRVFGLSKTDDAAGIEQLQHRMASDVYDSYIEGRKVAAQMRRQAAGSDGAH